jgi:flagellin-like hook-associated protein FlgL
MQRLSSGLRVNSSRDDPAGLSISSGIESQIRGLRQGVRNLNDAFALLQTAEGGVSTQIDLVQRMRELAVQGSNGTLGNQERSYLNAEMQALVEEFNRISSTTEFNGTKLLDGSFGTANVQVGSLARQAISVGLSSSASSQIFTKTVGTNTYSNSYSQNIGLSSISDPLVADINHDGIPDVVEVNGANSNIAIRLGRGDGTFASATTLAMANSGYGGALGDLNNDGNLDIVSVTRLGRVAVNFGNGDGSFRAYQSLFVGSGSNKGAVIADIDGNGTLDVLNADSVGNFVAVILGNGNGTFASAMTFAVGSAPKTNPIVADINGDGKLDIVQANTASAFDSILLGNGNGTFMAALTAPVGAVSLAPAVVCDVNQDSKLDIIQANISGSGVSVLLGNGNGTFSVGVTLSSGHSVVGTPVAVDLNGDGLLDLVVPDYGAQATSIFIGNGNGTFSIGSTLAIGAIPLTPLVADLDGDGKIDILQGPSVSGSVYAFSGDGHGNFTLKSVMDASGPSGAADTKNGNPISADLNGDGFLDFVICNYDNATVVSGNLIAFIQQTRTQSASNDLNISTQTLAQDSLGILDAGLSALLAMKANIGALESRLESARNLNDSTIQNLASARSQMIDADFAQESAEFTRLQILQKAGIAVLSQANLSAQLSLKLLQNL